jgi:hypothetical protein
MRVISRITVPSNVASPSTRVSAAQEENPENVSPDDQASMEDFLKEETG